MPQNYNVPAPESAASRFNRDWAQIKDDRKVRGLDKQDIERRKRVYVGDDGKTPAAPDA